MTWATDGRWYGPRVNEYESDDGIRKRATRHWSGFVEFKMGTMPFDCRADKFSRDLKVDALALELLYEELDKENASAAALVKRIKWLENKIGNRAPSPTPQETRYSSGQVGMLDPAVAEQEG